jgi:hypothetical protein
MAIPDFQSLPIPRDINVWAVPRYNSSEDMMKVCCAPNEVNIAYECIAWCEIPEKYYNYSSAKANAKTAANSGMGACMRSEGRHEGISGFQWVGAAPLARAPILLSAVALFVSLANVLAV